MFHADSDQLPELESFTSAEWGWPSTRRRGSWSRHPYLSSKSSGRRRAPEEPEAPGVPRHEHFFAQESWLSMLQLLSLWFFGSPGLWNDTRLRVLCLSVRLSQKRSSFTVQALRIIQAFNLDVCIEPEGWRKESEPCSSLEWERSSSQERLQRRQATEGCSFWRWEWKGGMKRIHNNMFWRVWNAIRNNKLLGTSASLLVTSALLLVTRSY